MNKCTLAFVISHLKQAIYELEVANKLIPNSIDTKLIDELKDKLKNKEKELKEMI